MVSHLAGNAVASEDLVGPLRRALFRDKRMQSEAPGSFDRWNIILPALLISGIGALFYNVLPLFLGTAQESRHLDNQQLGFLSASFFIGYNALTISAFFWIRRWNWRLVTAIALPVGCAAMACLLATADYYVMLAMMVVAGAGFSAVYGIGTTILADTANPTRWYGVKIAAEAAPGAVLLFFLPMKLVPEYGFDGVVIGMLAMVLLMIPGLLTLPAMGAPEKQHATEEQLEVEFERLDRSALWRAILATLVFFTAASAMWAFLERLADARNYAAESVGSLLSLTLVTATLGSLMTAWLSDRHGNVMPFLGCCLGFLLSLACLYPMMEFSVFAIAVCALTFFIGMGIPFAVARVAELDRDGRFVILSVPAVGLGAMAGPALAGLTTQYAGFDYLLLSSALLIVITMRLAHRSG